MTIRNNLSLFKGLSYACLFISGVNIASAMEEDKIENSLVPIWFFHQEAYNEIAMNELEKDLKAYRKIKVSKKLNKVGKVLKNKKIHTACALLAKGAAIIPEPIAKMSVSITLGALPFVLQAGGTVAQNFAHEIEEKAFHSMVPKNMSAIIDDSILKSTLKMQQLEAKKSKVLKNKEKNLIYKVTDALRLTAKNPRITKYRNRYDALIQEQKVFIEKMEEEKLGVKSMIEYKSENNLPLSTDDLTFLEEESYKLNLQLDKLKDLKGIRKDGSSKNHLYQGKIAKQERIEKQLEEIRGKL